MSPARWVEVLTEAGESGLDIVTFSGGDPLAYRWIDALLAVASRYRMAFTVPTKTFVSRGRARELARLIADDA